LLSVVGLWRSRRGHPRPRRAARQPLHPPPRAPRRGGV